MTLCSPMNSVIDAGFAYGHLCLPLVNQEITKLLVDNQRSLSMTLQMPKVKIIP